MAQTPIPEPKTLVINNWSGRLTRFKNGDINSGLSNYYSNWGTDTFASSGILQFYQTPTDITKGVITDLIMDGKMRVESGITYAYCLGHTGRIYKIQVNDLATKNPDYDTPVLLATLANGQTFKFGASLDFYQGVSEKIWIGHDHGITNIKFDGTSETNFLNAGWVDNVPRQQEQFAGKIYFTNGSNLAEVSASESVTSYTKLSPGFPSNSQARDIGLTTDGRYLVTVVTRSNLGDMTSISPDTNSIAGMPSSIVYWNGTDTAASSEITFPAFTTTSYYNFSKKEYVFGYQIGGAQMGTIQDLVQLLDFENPPLSNALASSGDFVAWASTMWQSTNGKLAAVLDLYGKVEPTTPSGMYRQLLMYSSLTNGDVIRIPSLFGVTSIQDAGITSGYTIGAFGTGKTYFSTLEYDGSTTKYGYYMFKNVTDFLGSSCLGVYETQHQLFSKKIKATEVRVYFSPVSADGITSFQIDLIGIDGNVITGTTKTFSPITTSGDRLKYNPSSAPTCAIGLRVTNLGVFTPSIHKVEIDYEEAGN